MGRKAGVGFVDRSGADGQCWRWRWRALVRWELLARRDGRRRFGGELEKGDPFFSTL